MVFQEPKAEFVEIETKSIIASTGAGYTVCERVNGNNIGAEDYCIQMEVANMPWDELCASIAPDDPMDPNE